MRRVSIALFTLLIMLILTGCRETSPRDFSATAVTNGAEDNFPGSGEWSSDIVDGSLDYLPVGTGEDGCVGCCNSDYNELLWVKVTIDLGGEYEVTGIRYNMGNVQRAETWNADSMTSPFGTTATQPGTPSTGAWTEQTGCDTLSSVVVTLYKTRTSWATDWLFIGEIEVQGAQLRP
jgi:hypothetical protein